MDVKKIDIEKNSFVANGRKYTFNESLSLARYKEFEKLQIRIGFGTDFEHIFNELKDIFHDLDNQKLANSAVRIHNLMNGIAVKIDEREDPMLLTCALFINREDEDLTKFDLNLAKDKISDWVEEGFDVADFFTLAKSLVRGFTEAYDSVSLDISEKQKREL